MKQTLPVDAVLPELLEALRRGPAAVLEAPPGAGKTTRVPPALLDLVHGDVVVLEPRRIAARAAARWVAKERGEKLGETVGYQIRFEEVRSARTRLHYVTEGILARRLLGDSDLRGVGAVVLDEFHERHLPADVSLALLQQLLTRRRDLKLVVMSATLDAAAIARHLDAPVVRSEGRLHRVEIEHLPAPDDRRLADQVAAAVRRLTVPGTEGHTLVFLPGAAEIRQSAEACDEIARHRGLVVLPLHGDLPGDEQDRALAPSRERKLILSTNVAETSVTVEGVTSVVDSGLARIATHSPWSGLPALQVGRISRASAAQRAGRAGRTGPGRAFRLYTRHDHDARPEHHPPEIERLDLAATVLDLRAAGLDPPALPWLDPPPQGALNAAEELLRRLGAVDAAGRATELGRACARLPVHPRLARIAVEAARRGHPDAGAAVAALLSDRDVRIGREAAPTGRSDVLELLDLLDEARRLGFSRARDLGVDPNGARRADQARQQILRSLPHAGVAAEPRDEALLVSVLAGFPDRVGKRRGTEVLLSGGGGAALSAQSAVREAPLLVAVEAEERREGGRSRAVVRLASAVEPEWLLDLFPQELRERSDLVWDAERERVEAVTRLTYGELALEETRRRPSEEEADRAAEILFEHARFDQAAIDVLRARASVVAQHCPEAGVSALSDEAVRAALRALCEGRSSLEEIERVDLASSLFSPQARAALDRLAPEAVSLASGRRLPVEYAAGRPPAVRSRLQDFFGLARGPAICAGRLPLVLHLLAPNGRAQQVTQDLAGFWDRHYPAVRRELMRKYPRHPWPENGATAAPPTPRPRAKT